jgi:GH25 family lysozyme M1 (1,4-beta-N-acetylmuramidase)
MKKSFWVRAKAAVLSTILLGMGIAGTTYGYAEEISTDITVEMTDETIDESETEHTAETKTIVETETKIQAGIESESELETETELEIEKTELVENSFRYENGEWIHNEIAMFASGFTPWSFENGNWINSLGEPIKGAIEKGIDVSFAQGKIDWKKVAATDISYAIIRCGYGNDEVSQDDKWWKYNADECTRLEIPFGVYIYSYALNTDEALSEAEHVLRLIEGYDLSYPIYLDLEDERYTGSLSNKEIADIAEVFCETIQSAGYEVGIYANLDWFRNRLTDGRFGQWTRWVAQYNTECTYKKAYTMWQCTSMGTVDGIDGFVDLNFTMDITPEEEEINTPEKMVENFVTRLYELVLGRKPDKAGLEGWKSQLLNQVETGADVLQGFINSDELKAKNLTNDAFVELLYNVCLGRNSDKEGKGAWISCLEKGLSRTYVLKGFAESEEFTDICSEYDIIRGNITLVEKEDLYPEITQYLYRCYRVFLNREPDTQGLRQWIDAFIARGEKPDEITKGFVFSKELNDKKLDDEEFVKILYKGLFDREADDVGLHDWINWLNSGKSRQEVFWGFTNSDEFHKLVNSFGL